MNYQEILLVINFIILFYIIYKINCLENDKIETFDATTDAAIRQAVNQVYTVDVDAIRSLSKFAIALTQGGMTVPGDLTIAGSIKDNRIDFGYNDTSREANAGKIEYGTFDPTALCIVGKGVPNTRRKVKIWDDVIVENDLNVGGNTTVNGILKVTTIQPDGNVHLSSSNGDVYLLAKGNNVVSKAWGGSGDLYVEGGLKVNHNISTDKDIIVASTKNIYTDSIGNDNELKIYSKQGARISKGWGGNGNLAVEGNLYVDNVLTADKNYTVLKGGSNGNTNNEATFFGHPDGNNYIRGTTRFDRGDVTFGHATFNSIKIGNWTIRQGDHGHLHFMTDGTNYNADYNSIPGDHGFVAMASDGNIWVNRNRGKRGWVSDIPIGNIECDNIKVINYLDIGNDWTVYQNNITKKLDLMSKIIRPQHQDKMRYSFANDTWQMKSCTIQKDITNYKNNDTATGCRDW